MSRQTSLIAMAAMAACFAFAPATSSVAFAADAAPAASVVKKEGWFHTLATLAEVAKVAELPKAEGSLLIDSRPTARKYDLGHIPTALNIPDTAFDKMAATALPAKKDTFLIFYCEGYECILSHQSAFKAEKLGYTQVKVFAEGFPGWVQAGNLPAISVPYLKKLLDEKAPLVLIDSRPKERKYDKGHIPGAISLPDSAFDKMAASVLPADKATPLYFYCEGLSCKLSSDSAEKARKLGYTKVTVVPEGWPKWAELYGAGDAPKAAPVIQAGKESGTIAVASFEDIFKNAPATINLIDVREPKEFAAGTFKGAVNFPINKMEELVGKLPSDKPIVFFCGAGGRSGEAYDMVKLARPELKTYFLDANIKWTQDGQYTIQGK